MIPTAIQDLFPLTFLGQGCSRNFPGQTGFITSIRTILLDRPHARPDPAAGFTILSFQARPTMTTPTKIRATPTRRGLEIRRSIQNIETSAVIRMLTCRNETT